MAPPADALRLFQDAYGQHVPECPRFSLPQLTVDMLKSQAKRIPDGWVPELWLFCPDALWEGLQTLLNICEELGQWPEATTHWRVVCIPKANAGSEAVEVDKVRPIAIGPILYRMYAGVRAKQLSPLIGSRLAAGHAGGNQGADAQVQLLDMHLPLRLQAASQGCYLSGLCQGL